MTKYRPVVDLWDVDTVAAIEAGRIRLQRGQFVRCGSGGPLSRFVGYNGRSFNVVHGGTAAEVSTKFKARCEVIRHV